MAASSTTPLGKSAKITLLSSPKTPSLESTPSSVETSGRALYLEKAQELKIMDLQGAVTFLGTDPVTLDSNDQETVHTFWKTPKKFQQDGWEFSWNLFTFFSYLVPAFTSRFVNAKVALTRGGLCALGEAFWKKKLEKKYDPQLFGLITPQMWDFCKTEPSCYEVWVTLPSSMRETPDVLERLINFSYYCIAVQSLPHLPANHTKALAEFNHFFNKDENSHAPSSPAEEKESLRPHEVEEAMGRIKTHKVMTDLKSGNTFEVLPGIQMSVLKAGKTVEVFCGSMSMKITFAFEDCNSRFLMDDFHLELKVQEDNLLSTPRFPAPIGLNLIHHYLVCRFSFRDSLDGNTAPDVLGRYWAYLTSLGAVLHGTVLEHRIHEILKSRGEEGYSRALEAGKQYLPQGTEPLLAYYFNSQRPQIPADIGGRACTPLGNLLASFLAKNPASHGLDAVLCMVGSLSGSLMPTFCCTAVFKNGIEVRWETPVPVYLRIGLSLDEALDKIIKDRTRIFPLINQVLDIFLPSLQALPSPQLASTRNAKLSEILKHLKKEMPFSSTLLHFYLFLRATGNLLEEDLQVHALPSWVNHAHEKEELETTLESLATVYRSSRYDPVFCAVQRRVTELGQAHEQAASEALLLSGEPKIFSSAWNAYVRKFETDVEFLIKIASVADVNTLPAVLKHVYEKNVPVAQDRLRLLVTYFNQLSMPGYETLYDIHSQPLVDQIKEITKQHSLDVGPNPKLKDRLIDPAVKEMGKLREELSSLASQPNPWWQRLLKIQLNPEHQEAFDALLKDAVQSQQAKPFISSDPVIFSSVWNLYLQRFETDVTFLMRIAPLLDVGSLPVVVRHVCEKKVASDPDRLKLLVTYFNQVTSPGFRAVDAAHGSQLVEGIRVLAQTCPLDLDSNPKLKDRLMDPAVREMGKLREGLSALNSNPDPWWRRLLKLQPKSEHQKEFDALLKEAVQFQRSKPFLSRDPQIFSSVWNLYLQRFETDIPFLIRIAPLLDVGTLPIVLKHVSQKKGAEGFDRLRLLVTYFNQVASPGFEAVDSAHSPQLVEEIRVLAQTSPLDLNSNPKLKERLMDPNLREIGRLRTSLASLKSHADSWWKSLQEVQKKLKSEHQEEFDALFVDALQSAAGNLPQKTGFKDIFSRVAANLLGQKKYRSLISLLGKTPITKSDQMVANHFKKLFQSLIDDKVDLAIWTAFLQELQSSKAHESLERVLLVRVLSHLTERFKPEEICAEIGFLRDHVQPTREEIPHLPGHLLSYYAGLKDPSPLIDDLSASLPLFVSWQEAGVNERLLSCAKLLAQTPQSRLWDKFAALLDKARSKDLFLEGKLQILEFLAATPAIDRKAVVRCFKTPIAPKRLDAAQKRRLAQAYGSAMRQASKGQAAEIVKGVPSREWIFEQLKNEASWQSYFRFFFYLSSEQAINSESLIWGVPFLIASPEAGLVQECYQFIWNAQPKNLNSTWKFSVVGLIACDVSNELAGKLLSLLSVKAPEEERRFFEHCYVLRQKGAGEVQECQRLLKEYRETEVMPRFQAEEVPVPPAQREKVEQLLSKQPASLVNWKKAMALLQGFPSSERDLWLAFFKATPANAEADDLAAAWKAWLDKHPIEEVQETDERYWVAAVDACFPKTSVDLLDAFLEGTLIPVINHLKPCEQLVRRCLEVGTEICRKRPAEKNNPTLRALHTLIANETLREKVGDPRLLPSVEFRIQLALLLAEQQDDLLYQAGNEWFFPTMMNPGSEIKREILFGHYCARPYIPRGPQAQAAVYVFLTKRWAGFKHTLSWEQSCGLLRVLCRFSDESHAQAPEAIYTIWKELALGTSIQKNAIEEMVRTRFHLPSTTPIEVAVAEKPQAPMPFILASKSVLESLAKKITVRAQGFAQLAQMHQDFGLYLIRTNQTSQDQPIARFQMLWCQCVFSPRLENLSPDELEVISQAVVTFKSAIPAIQQQWGELAKSVVGTFASKALPFLVENTSTPKGFADLSSILKGLALVPAVVAENGDEKFGFEVLLTSLCQGVSQSSNRSIAQMALKFFMDLMAPPPLIKKDQTALQNITRLKAYKVFFSSFLTLEEVDCVDEKEWEELFSKLSFADIKTFGLDEYAKRDPSSLGLAPLRLIRWTKPSSPESLVELEKACLKFGGDYVQQCHPAAGDIDELHILAEWFHAVSALQSNHESLKALKTTLINKIAPHLFTCIRNEMSYKICVDILLKATENDPEMLQAVRSSFIIRHDLPPELQRRLHLIQEIIDSSH